MTEKLTNTKNISTNSYQQYLMQSKKLDYKNLEEYYKFRSLYLSSSKEVRFEILKKIIHKLNFAINIINDLHNKRIPAVFEVEMKNAFVSLIVLSHKPALEKEEKTVDPQLIYLLQTINKKIVLKSIFDNYVPPQTNYNYAAVVGKKIYNIAFPENQILIYKLNVHWYNPN